MSASGESLLQKLKRLYMELFLVGLHERLNEYHAPLHSEKSHEISDKLHKLIDEIVHEASQNYSSEDFKKFGTTGTDLTGYPSSSGSYYRAPSGLASMTGNGLSLYLQKHRTEENDMHMSDRLQKCVWDHVHASHRFARAGNAATAKLHADIASNAMKTLSHYMPEPGYHEFTDAIHSQLENMSGQAKEK